MKEKVKENTLFLVLTNFALFHFFLHKDQLCYNKIKLIMLISEHQCCNKRHWFVLNQDCPTRGLRATFGQRSCFVWPARSFCAVDFLWERLTQHFLANKSLNQNLLVFGFPEISSDLRGRLFFLVFTYFLGQISVILSEINTNLRRRLFFGLHLLFGTDFRNTGQSEHRFCTTNLQLFGV